MENSAAELNRFKEEINLVDFAIRYTDFDYKVGYKNKSAENTTIVIVRNEKQPNEENLLIRINPANNQYVYFNPDNSLENGSIIDFCSNRLNLNIGQARKLCREYLGDPEVKKKKDTALTPSPPLKQSVIDEHYFKVRPLTDTSYLRSRHVHEPVINSPLFYSTMGIKDIEYEDKNGQKITYNNTAFLIKNLEGKTIGLSLKNNTGYSSFTGNLDESKTNGMWVSNPPAKKTSNLTFVITEHAIDALSHYQLNYNPLDDGQDVMYFASNGSLRNSHLDFVQHYIDKYNPKSIVLGNDNDLAGLRYNITYMGTLKPPAVVNDEITRTYSEDVRISCHALKPINLMTLNIYNNKNLDNRDLLENIHDTFKTFNHDLQKKYNHKKNEFNIHSIVQTDVVTEVKIHFDNRKELLLDCLELTKTLRPNNLIKVELPVTKDFNEDLKKFHQQEEKMHSLGR